MEYPTTVRRWYHWYNPNDTPEERKLLLKLDLLIVPYAFAVYWVKYIDQTNINNAYVSGMSEDLGFNGNQLVQLQSYFTVAATVGLLPFAYLFPKLPMHILVPTLDLGWGIFSLLEYRVQSYAEIAAYRIMIGLFESSYFIGVHFVLGSWYRKDEISRRGGLFYVGLELGTLTASLLQAAASSSLDGVNGLAGWRWNFIICSIITIPLALIGYFLWPGTPDMPNRRLLSLTEIALARGRLEREGAKLESSPFSWNTLKRIFSHWKIYLLIFWTSLFFNTSPNTAGFLLWIKSLGRYSTAEINNLGAIAPALGIFYVLFINFSADLWLGRPGAITLASALNFTGLIILTVWDVSEAAKWFAFCTMYSAAAVSSVLYGWANTILRHNVEDRAVSLVLMTVIAQSFTAWTPLLVYPTVEAPSYPKGYPYSAAFTVALVVTTWGVKWVHNREESRLAERTVQGNIEVEVEDPGSLGGGSVGEGK
ncbi:hypothetical protein BP6252_11238 [Coleophoma cylindrospora]|uniref:MFS general substrate transporter n=1 Tax=Coleophoma cylindrospora TaxID=1849047 RepID=A0A3D8QPE5_9HELO|nr:hypothetical protein BP6252_11238 [Coleophoma cylindrospora]